MTIEHQNIWNMTCAYLWVMLAVFVVTAIIMYAPDVRAAWRAWMAKCQENVTE